MTANYYINTYCLSKPYTEAFRVPIQDENHPISEEVITTFTERWHSEISPRCNDEVECRAVMFRTLLETVCKIKRPPKTTPMLAVAWAHMITDAIHQAVAANRPQAPRN